MPVLEARLDSSPLDLTWDGGADLSLARADLPDPERVGRRLYLRCELPVGVLPANAFPEPLLEQAPKAMTIASSAASVRKGPSTMPLYHSD